MTNILMLTNLPDLVRSVYVKSISQRFPKVRMHSVDNRSAATPYLHDADVLLTFAYTFAAQYQQRPIPPGGGSIKATWIRRYATLPEGDLTQVILSLDTASKDGCENDWSVCTAWLLHEEKYYLIDVMRIQADYPTLKERIIAFTKVLKPTKILIEDCGVGTALIADLKMVAQCFVVAVKPEQNKKTRIAVQAAKFEIWTSLFSGGSTLA